MAVHDGVDLGMQGIDREQPVVAGSHLVTVKDEQYVASTPP
jgi:hypothetical protein